MRWIARGLIAGCAALGMAGEPAQAQQPPASPPAPTVLDARLLPAFGVHGDDAIPVLRLPPSAGAAATRRPWWLVPLAGAGAGALLYELARGDECENTDCIIYIPPPLSGAVIGLAAGTVIEVGLRLAGS